MGRTFLPVLAATVATGVLLIACSDSSGVRTIGGSSTSTATAGTRPTSTVVATAASITWSAVGTSGRVQSGHLEVPMDYADASKGTFDLFVVRHLANSKQRIGTLLVNRGGPGFGSSDFALRAEDEYDKSLTDRFDIVGWDPRGTGLSTPAIDCIDDYDHFFAGTDITPDNPQDRQRLVDLAKEFADGCVKKNARFMPYIGTNNSARDMNSIRSALGESKISFFGFSYGSELGAAWATLFPATVRAAVFDGAADHSEGFTESALQQNAGFEQAINSFLANCNSDRKCPFRNGGNADKAFDSLMAEIDAHPIPTERGRPDLTRAMALTGVAEAMYARADWPLLQTALADAKRGHGDSLLQLYDRYFQRRSDGSYDNSLEAFQVISCQDDPERPTVAEDDATAPRYQKAAPRFAPSTVGSYFCTFFPPSIEPLVDFTGKGAGPILVMGTTGDSATPLVSTRKMAQILQDGRLVIVTAEGHTGYHANRCSENVIDRYLIDPVSNVPSDGTRC